MNTWEKSVTPQGGLDAGLDIILIRKGEEKWQPLKEE